jgi:hypothetical protein
MPSHIEKKTPNVGYVIMPAEAKIAYEKELGL